MTAGKYRHRVEFQIRKESQDEFGEPINSWDTVFQCWARVFFLSGRELWAAKQANSEVSGKVELRYRTDITPDMRIKYKDRILDIESIVPLEGDKREVHVMFKEQM